MDLIDVDVYKDVNGYKRYDISRCDYWWILFLVSFIFSIGMMILGYHICMVKNFQQNFNTEKSFVTDQWEDDEGNVFSVNRIYWGKDYQMLLEISSTISLGSETNVVWKSSGKYENYGGKWDGYKWWLKDKKKPSGIRLEEYLYKKRRICSIVNTYLQESLNDLDD